jgi:hypothetical protein
MRPTTGDASKVELHAELDDAVNTNYGAAIQRPRRFWDGDTLVVDTTSFAKEGMIAGTTRDLHLIERFTLADRNTLEYGFTVDDPGTFTRTWTASVPMSRIDEMVYEYGCHEGNEGMIGILRGVRFEEKNPRKEGPK